MSTPFSRREILQKSLALGTLVIASSHGPSAMLHALEQNEQCKPTPFLGGSVGYFQTGADGALRIGDHGPIQVRDLSRP